MKKRIICALFAAVLMASVIPFGASADYERCEVIRVDQTPGIPTGPTVSKAEDPSSDHFTLRSDEGGDDGLFPGGKWAGGVGNTFTVAAKGKGVRITHIEATFDEPQSLQALNYVRENNTVTVTDVNAVSVSFTGGYANSVLKSVDVYYETCADNGHVYNTNNVCIWCDLTKCQAVGHRYGDDGVCNVCSAIGCMVGDLKHTYENSVCTRCKQNCSNEFHNGTYKCPDCGMEFNAALGSTLSEGSLTIVLCVACLAVGLVGGLLLGKKKKKHAE